MLVGPALWQKTAHYLRHHKSYTFQNALLQWTLLLVLGYIEDFEIIDDHRAGKIVVNLTGRINKVITF